MAKIELCLGLSIIGLCLVCANSELQRFEHGGNRDGSLSFLVIGDWGRRGAFNQSRVALQVFLLCFVFVFLLV